MVIFDVWGGEGSQDHIARYIVSIDEAVHLARTEVEAGYLVNMRMDHQWGEYSNFDRRLAR